MTDKLMIVSVFLGDNKPAISMGTFHVPAVGDILEIDSGRTCKVYRVTSVEHYVTAELSVSISASHSLRKTKVICESYVVPSIEVAVELTKVSIAATSPINAVKEIESLMSASLTLEPFLPAKRDLRMLYLMSKVKQSVSDLCSLPDFDAIDSALDEVSDHIGQLREEVKTRKAKAEEAKLSKDNHNEDL